LLLRFLKFTAATERVSSVLFDGFGLFFNHHYLLVGDSVLRISLVLIMVLCDGVLVVMSDLV
jgi:hypothetical protein